MNAGRQATVAITYVIEAAARAGVTVGSLSPRSKPCAQRGWTAPNRAAEIAGMRDLSDARARCRDRVAHGRDFAFRVVELFRRTIRTTNHPRSRKGWWLFHSFVVTAARP